MVYDPAELRSARVIAVFVPGALARIGIFDPAKVWRDRGYGLIYYRFPGLDGRALHPPLDLDRAAADIASVLKDYPEKPLRLVGFSTGTAIVLKLAVLLTGRDLRVAAISPAVERAGGWRTTLRGTVDVLRAALSVRDVRVRPVWFSYYRVLLFGRRIYSDAGLEEQAARVIEARRARIVVPTRALLRAHTRDLKRWRLAPEECALGHRLRLYWGAEDVVFNAAQVQNFARRCGAARIERYNGHGHLLFATCPEAFDDILSFFEEEMP